jgi:hypothetical protein
MPVIKEVCVMHVNRNIVLFIFLSLTGFVIWIFAKSLDWCSCLGRSCEMYVEMFRSDIKS